MSKYIIEIAEEYEEYFKGVLICGIADGKFAVDVIAREDLEELNSDYINEHYGELQDEAYQAGLNDMWDVVRKISLMTSAEAEEVFAGAGSYNRYNLGYSGVEAMDAYKAYLEKKDRIEVGDWVYDDSDTPNSWAIVTWTDGDDACIMCKDGSTAEKKTHELRKTGRHFDIASILEAMRE